MIELNNIRKTFNKGSINENNVLKGIDLSLNEGDFVTVIGGNGAGKSTLLNVIAGNINVDEGKIIIDSNDVTNDDVIRRSKYISRVFQDTNMGTCGLLSIEENLSIALLRGQKRGLKKAIKNSNLKLFKDSLEKLDLNLEKRIKTAVSHLSGGQRQALTLLMATLVKPKLLLLDEHTAALDPKTTATVLDLTEKLVSENNITTIMVTHDMEDALKYGNRLIMLHSGRKVVDIGKKEKSKMNVQQLVDLFHKNSGELLKQDSILL